MNSLPEEVVKGSDFNAYSNNPVPDGKRESRRGARTSSGIAPGVTEDLVALTKEHLDLLTSNVNSMKKAGK